MRISRPAIGTHRCRWRSHRNRSLVWLGGRTGWPQPALSRGAREVSRGEGWAALVAGERDGPLKLEPAGGRPRRSLFTEELRPAMIETDNSCPSAATTHEPLDNRIS